MVVGLAIGAAVVGVREQPGAGRRPVRHDHAARRPAPSAAALLDDASMLTPEGARPIDGKRTWTAGTTVRGPVPDGSGAACLGSDPLEGAPTAQQTITRTLTANGSSTPRRRCTSPRRTRRSTTRRRPSRRPAGRWGPARVTGDWLVTGRVVEGVGDEATAVAVHSVVGGQRTAALGGR